MNYWFHFEFTKFSSRNARNMEEIIPIAVDFFCNCWQSIPSIYLNTKMNSILFCSALLCKQALVHSLITHLFTRQKTELDLLGFGQGTQNVSKCDSAHRIYLMLKWCKNSISALKNGLLQVYPQSPNRITIQASKSIQLCRSWKQKIIKGWVGWLVESWGN